ncbi:MAG: MFS transporter [Bacteroidales bacterium]|nr:MFS transporter [Bacteroidales bacterium]MCB8998459.1 MFS transporter [Bacteroidales bacterium]MCB9012902.1 MFS transporter [Bacteroidales bacterium]
MKNKANPEGYLFSRRYTNYVFILLFLLYMFDYVDRMIITSLFPFLKAEWLLTDTQCGMMVSAVYWSIVLFTFPISILVDRWSRRKTIGVMAIIWSIATAAGAFTRSFSHLFATRTAIGVGEAGYAPGGSAMISGMYPLHKRAWMMGLWNASIPLGSAIGIAIGGIIATHWGWRHALGIVAIPGLIIGILFLFVKDYKTVKIEKPAVPEELKLSKTESSGEPASKIKAFFQKPVIKEFIRKPSLIYTYFAMAGVVFTTSSLLTWLPSYFHRVQGIPESTAGLKSSAVMLLAIIGAPLGGYLSDRWRKTRVNARLLFPTITTLLSGLILFLAFTVFQNQIQYALLLSLGICITAFISAAGAVTQDLVHPGLRAVSYAIAVVVQNLIGASLGPIVMGKISDLTNIQTAFSFLPIALIISGILFYLGSRHYEKDMDLVAKIELEARD